jgi:phage shock protein PspC (stress-responsive transcriptional regulator)
MLDRFQHHRAMISGVCAWMADQSGVPVWIIRGGALLLLLGHAVLATLVYLAGAYALRHAAPPAGLPAEDRFVALDRRIARLEAAVLREGRSFFF